jgi:hypothetical protein
MSTEETEQWEELDKLLVNLVREQKPETVQQLVEMVHERYSYPEDEIIERVSVLQDRGHLSLGWTRELFPASFLGYVFSDFSGWFWFIVASTLSITFVVSTVPEDAFPLAYARQALGIVYVLFLPGYCLLRAIFPKKELEYLEQAVLSLGLSIFLIFLTGLLLNYLPWGLALTPIVLSLLIVTLLFSLVALFREYKRELLKVSGTKE